MKIFIESQSYLRVVTQSSSKKSYFFVDMLVFIMTGFVIMSSYKYIYLFIITLSRAAVFYM